MLSSSFQILLLAQLFRANCVLGGHSTNVRRQLDSTAPLVACQDATASLWSGGQITIPDVVTSSSDNVGIVRTTLSTTTPYTCADLGVNSLSATVRDAAGNSAMCDVDITVVDDIVPQAVCAPATVYLDGAGQGVLSAMELDVGSSDNCDLTPNLTVDTSVFGCTETGANDVSLSVTDASGNAATCPTTATVVDDISPVLSCPATPVPVELTGAQTPSATLDPATFVTVSDNCPGAIVTTSPMSYDCTDVGSVFVTVEADDASANFASCDVILDVYEDEDPSAVCQPTVSVGLEASVVVLSASLVDDGSTDNCAITSYSLDKDTFSCGDIGVSAVTLTVEDSSGNMATCSSTVTVTDERNPDVDCVDATVSINRDGIAPIDTSTFLISATDNCGSPTLEVDIKSISCGMRDAPITVTLTATDTVGRLDSCQQKVTAVDDSPPIPTCNDHTISLDQTGIASLDATAFSATDNCSDDDQLSVEFSKETFDCSSAGMNIVTATFTDEDGNAASCQAMVIVLEDPVACPTEAPSQFPSRAPSEGVSPSPTRVLPSVALVLGGVLASLLAFLAGFFPNL